MPVIHAGAKPATAIVAANDNGPRQSDSFANLTARCGWLDSLPKKADPVLAWPRFERLAHLGDPVKLGVLMRWRDMTAPTRTMTAANDNAEPEEANSADDVDLAREI